MFKVSILCFLINSFVLKTFAQETVLTVIPGGFYSTSLGLGLGLFNNFKEPLIKIKFSRDCSQYLFGADDNQGTLCSNSWNKLWGTVRCGMFNSNHQDSDRFVWRRAQSCLKFSGSYVVGEVEDCPEKDLIELAAYTYDNGAVPFSQENAGILLKIFQTKVKVETWYIYKLIITPFNTVYQLFDDNHQLLESATIEHRECGSSFYIGALQTLYFGGQCPAPQKVSATYKQL